MALKGNSPTARAAIEVILAQAAAYIENKQEGVAHGRDCNASTSDEQIAEWAAGDEYELDEYNEIRDFDRASDTVNAILQQKGCEHFDSAVDDGLLTTLIDVIVFG